LTNGGKILKNIIIISIIIISVLLTLSCGLTVTKDGGMAVNYFEYSRGKSSHTTSDLYLKYDNNEYTFKDMKLIDKSFFPDDSIFPNAFIKPLFKLQFGDAVKAFTEPYYSYRFIHFLKSNPNIGIGIEFIHLKVFLEDIDQNLITTGNFDGKEINLNSRVGDYITMFNVSHGVNHLGLHLTYRWMFNKTEKIKDGKFQPYINISAGPAIPHLEMDLVQNGTSSRVAYSYQSGFKNWGIGAGAGIRFKPWQRFGFYLEYKTTYSHLYDMHLDDFQNSSVKMSFVVHHLQWGLSFMF
jgi:hypothetical protein